MKIKPTKTYRVFLCDDVAALGRHYIKRCFNETTVTLSYIVGDANGVVKEKPVRVYKSKDYNFCIMSGGDEVIDCIVDILDEHVYGDPIIPVTINYILFCPTLLSAFASVPGPSTPGAEECLYKICQTWLTFSDSMNIESVRQLTQSLTGTLQGPEKNHFVVGGHGTVA